MQKITFSQYLDILEISNVAISNSDEPRQTMIEAGFIALGLLGRVEPEDVEQCTAYAIRAFKAAPTDEDVESLLNIRSA